MNSLLAPDPPLRPAPRGDREGGETRVSRTCGPRVPRLWTGPRWASLTRTRWPWPCRCVPHEPLPASPAQLHVGGSAGRGPGTHLGLRSCRQRRVRTSACQHLPGRLCLVWPRRVCPRTGRTDSSPKGPLSAGGPGRAGRAGDAGGIWTGEGACGARGQGLGVSSDDLVTH